MDDQFSKLASKVLAGEANNEEKRELKQLISDSKENTLLFNQLKEYWDADVQLNKMKNDSFEKAVISRINFEPEIRRIKHRKLYFRIASVAAIIFFTLTCGIAYLYITQPKEIYTYSAQSVPVEYQLADGTKVTLNKNSSLTFSSDFGEKRRDVKLIGEAFFKVTKDKSRPFAVEALGTQTEVLGTSFNVHASSKTGNVITTLVEGSVKFKAKDIEQMLKPGEEIAFNTNSQKYALTKTDTQYNTAWVSGRYNYKNITFAEFANKLEKIYKLDIVISDSRIANRVVSASFLTDQPVEDILRALENELEFSYEKADSTKINIVYNPLRN